MASQSELKAPLRRWEEAGDEDFCNPDKLLVCPYDPHHQIRACRFPYHLIKCKKNHPELANQLWTCPFNARHLMPKHELSHHLLNCVDRCSVSTDCVEIAETQRKFQVPINNWTTPECDEDWDQEERDVPASPFFRGLSTSQLGQERSIETLFKMERKTRETWKKMKDYHSIESKNSQNGSANDQLRDV